MNGHRRRFLSGLGTGLLGVVGFLLPRRASAWHRRRRGGCPEALPVPALAQGGITVAAYINIDYPIDGAPAGPAVPGGGGFCAWGSSPSVIHDSLTASATWPGLTTPKAGALIPVTTNPLDPCSWGFTFAQVMPPSPTTVVTLTVSGVDAGNNSVSATSKFTIGAYTSPKQ